MKKSITLLALLLIAAIGGHAQSSAPSLIEVTGSATLNIVPDRISIEIGMEEYYKKNSRGDSTLVRLADIEKSVRKRLRDAGVPDSLIITSDLGNYKRDNEFYTFLMAKRLSATVSDFNKIETISDRLGRNGITSFNITSTDNSDMSRYNKEGLKSALDAARRKAEFIAENEGLKIMAPYEIIETTNEPAIYSAFSNIAFNRGAGMENLKRIVRRYSVKVRYLFSVK